MERSAADEEARRRDAERARRAWREKELESAETNAARAAEEAPRRRMPPVGTNTEEVASINDTLLTVGSETLERELRHILRPLWSILDERAIGRYGQMSLQQLAIRRWNEALADDGQPRGSHLTRMHFETLVKLWMEEFVHNLADKRIILDDDQDVNEILDLWKGQADQQGRLPTS